MTKKEAVKKLVSKLDKKTWTSKVYARDKYGHEIDPYSNKAVRRCATGLLSKIIGKCTDEPKIFTEIRFDFHTKYSKTMVETNDLLGFEVVKERFANLYKD